MDKKKVLQIQPQLHYIYIFSQNILAIVHSYWHLNYIIIIYDQV